ncbi:FixH family protein [Pseudooceanicola sp. C21-150M6]|uniref:FixH family protein n=1 Tax=Pseudooceanicola sp. C21-150M6 TaxID=3434355 RepID=UPI003D7F1EF2
MDTSHMTDTPETGFRLKGWHVLTGFVGAFGIIIAVNVFMATQAVRTFPGLEVKNSYVASQEFDTRRAAQQALGWEIYADWVDGMVHLYINDAEGAVRVKDLHAVVGRATQIADDVEPVFAFNGERYEAPLDLGPGNWNIRMTAIAEDGTEFIQRVILHVKR